jgi:hypothetical protein
MYHTWHVHPSHDVQQISESEFETIRNFQNLFFFSSREREKLSLSSEAFALVLPKFMGTGIFISENFRRK